MMWESCMTTCIDKCTDFVANVTIFNTLESNNGYCKVLVAENHCENTNNSSYLNLHVSYASFSLCQMRQANFDEGWNPSFFKVRWQSPVVSFDEIVIFSQSPEKHIKLAGQGPEVIILHGVKRNQNRWSFLTNHIHYLSNLISLIVWWRFYIYELRHALTLEPE